MIATLASSGEAEPEPALPGQKSPKRGEPLPPLDDLLKKVPASSRELIETLFAGQFTSVKAIDREKLY